MHYRPVFCAAIISVVVLSEAMAQGAADSGKGDQELIEIRQTLAEISEVLSRMAVSLDRIEDTLNRRAGMNLRTTTANEDADRVLFPPDVERAMIPEGQIYRGFEMPWQGQETPYGPTRSILEPPLNALEKIRRQK